jgi:hypothetical protein
MMKEYSPNKFKYLEVYHTKVIIMMIIEHNLRSPTLIINHTKFL